MTRAARHADVTDNGQDQILGRDTRAQAAGHLDGQRAGLSLQQALGRQHVPDLGGADAEGQRAEGAVGTRVAVTADNRASGLGEPELRADHMNDPAVRARDAVQLDAEVGAVVLERSQLPGGGAVRRRQAFVEQSGQSRSGVIHGGDSALRSPHAGPGFPQHGERLW